MYHDGDNNSLPLYLNLVHAEAAALHAVQMSQDSPSKHAYTQVCNYVNAWHAHSTQKLHHLAKGVNFPKGEAWGSICDTIHGCFRDLDSLHIENNNVSTGSS